MGRRWATTTALVLAAIAALAVGSQDDARLATHALAVTADVPSMSPPPSPSAPSSPSATASIRPSPIADPTSSTAPVVPSVMPANDRPSPSVASAAAIPAAVPAVPPAAASAPSTPASCPATWLCYPRVGIAGEIVPYTDCTGRTDVGTQIRSFSCLSERYLMGHAYTSFGRIADWRAGDPVTARGVTYHVARAFQQPGCTSPVLPLAPLTLQTSLTSSACGAVLIVQAE